MRNDLLRFGWQGLAVVLIAIFVVSTIYGQYINYSPVPIMDYWNGVLSFYVESMQSPEAWWIQHNEHRILLSKLLFWLDMRYFDGLSILLVPINTLLLLLVACVLMAYANNLVPERGIGSRMVLAALVVMFCLAWMQNQNIIWGFQSQFILVYLLPLCSFYALARAQFSAKRAWQWRSLAIGLGVASAYSMANGLLTLPILAVLCWLMERSLKRVLVVSVVCVLSTLVFFIGYESTVGGSIGLEFLLSDPLRVLIFSLSYIGNPVYWITGNIGAAAYVGACAVVLSVFFFWRRKSFSSEPHALALLAFVVYVFGTAGITAIGRAFFDLTLSASSRYTTPSLLMWVSLLILFLAKFWGAGRTVRWAMALVAVLFLPSQMNAFTLDTGMFTPHQKAVAALSLRMYIDEEQAKRQLHPFFTPKEEASLLRAREAKVSIFSADQEYPVNQLGRRMAQAGGQPCRGKVEKTRPTDTQKPAVAIYGALDANEPTDVGYILFGDSRGLVKGIAIAGRDQPGYGGEAGARNFDGFLLNDGSFQDMRCVHK